MGGHFLISCCMGAVVLLVTVLCADFAANSFSSDTLFAIPESPARCSSANSDHFLVSVAVDCSRACSSSSSVIVASSSIYLSFDAFEFLRDCGLFTYATSGDLRFVVGLGSDMVLIDCSSCSSCPPSTPWTFSSIYESLRSSLSSNGFCCCA